MSATATSRKELYVFDSAVADLRTLLDALGGDQRVLTLDANSDGVLQLADALAGESGLDAIHIFSHGSVGSIWLGSALLDQASLAAHSEALAKIGSALTDSGDLLLYGCNVAQGAVGQAFIEQLAVVTGADVAASADLTGATGLHGNWLLEARTGKVEATTIEAEQYTTAVLQGPQLNQQSNYDLNAALDAARLAAAYDLSGGAATVAQEIIAQGWTPLTTAGGSLILDAAGGILRDNGFASPLSTGSDYAFAATRMVAGVKEYAISFAGTDFSDFGDIQSDFQTYGFTRAYKAVRDLFVEVLRRAATDQANQQDVKILIAGHSLGGAIAQAAYADLLATPGQALWQNDPSAPLGIGDRLYDQPGVGSLAADIRALATQTEVITFGAPSLLIDPYKLDATELAIASAAALIPGLSWAAVFGLLTLDILSKIGNWNNTDLNINESLYKSHLVQFEHWDTSAGASGDPVAQLDDKDLGAVIKIDISNVTARFQGADISLHGRYQELIGIADFIPLAGVPLHFMANYIESILRAITNSPLLSSAHVADSDSPILPASLSATPSNDLVAGAAYEFGGDGNDILFAVPGTVTMNGGSGDDAYVIKGAGVDVWVGGSLPERVDHLYFEGNGSVTVDPVAPNSEDLVLHLTASGSTSTVRVSGWYSNNDPSHYPDGTAYQLASIGQISTADLTHWTERSYDFKALGIPLLNKGTTESDVILGSLSNDSMSGGEGNDDMRGRVGNDLMFGEDGNDTLIGGDGNDVLDGGAGSDSVDAGTGDDTITGSTGNDIIDGGTGTDKLIIDQDLSGSVFSSGVVYQLNGYPATLYSGSSQSEISTGLTGSATRYFIQLGSLGYTDATNIEQFQVDLTGTANTDLLIYQNGTRYHGGAGTDTFYANWSGVTSAITWANNSSTTQVINVGGSNVSLNGLERLLLATGSGNDFITNTLLATDDWISTGSGNDTVAAGGGYDRVDTGTGDDIITGSTGNDTIDGGAGSDKLIIDQDLTGSTGSYLSYWIDGYPGWITYGADYSTISAALTGSATRYVIQLGSLGYTDATNIEQFQVDLTGTANTDLLIYQNGTRYHGGAGTDTFYANWSGVTSAITWANNSSTTQVINVGGSNVSLNGLERLLLATGSGNDFITNTLLATDDWISTGSGNDTVAAGGGYDHVDTGTGDDIITGSTGNDTVDGGAGTDKLIIDQDLTGLIGSSLSYFINGYPGWMTYAADYSTISTALTGSATRYVIQLGSLGYTDATNIEQFQVDLTGTANTDLLIYQNGTRYHGGAGTDTFYANWSGVTSAITWANNSSTTQVINVGGSNVSLNGLERLLLATGSGNDFITNTLLATDDWISTGSGNDTVAAGGGYDHVDTGTGDDIITGSTGNDTVDGGAGTDKLIIDQDLTGLIGSSLSYFINGYPGWMTYAADYSTISTALTGSATRYAIQLGSLGYTDATNIEQFQVDLTGTANNDLLIYQNGTRYHGGAGTDTFYADWSGVTSAITWANNSSTTQTVNVGGSNVSLNGLERLLLTTGSGNDYITNTLAGTNNWISTGSGNDTVATGGGWDHVDTGTGDDSITGSTGSDVIDGGSGTDMLILDLDLTGSISSSLGYFINGYPSWMNYASDYSTISTGLTGAATRYAIQLGSLGSTDATSIEQFQVDLTGTANNDLLIYQNGTRYHGGAGTDTFYADWSGVTSAITWINDPATTQAVNIGGSNVSLSSLERLLLTTGSGNDQISNTMTGTNNWISTGSGNDTVAVGWGANFVDTGAGNDTIEAGAGSNGVDGGSGTDKLILDLDLSAAGNVLRYWINNSNNIMDSRSAYSAISTELAGAATRYVIYLGGLGYTDAANVEQFQVDLTGTGSNDLLIYQNGTRYHGGAGTDTFYADWSGVTSAITWINDPATTQAVNVGGSNVSLSSLERLLLTTGSGNDHITNTLAGTDNWISTGSGNDTVAVGRGANFVDTGAGNDTIEAGAGSNGVDGGSGNDKLILDLDLSAAGNVLRYWINNSNNIMDSRSAYSAISTELAGAATRYVIYLGGLGYTDAANVEQFQVDLTGTGSNDLLIYQNGTRYHGGAGTDTFYADWSGVTSAITWINDPATTQAVNVGGSNVSLSSLERLLLTTGSGNDQISNTLAGTDNWISTGSGNDTVAVGTGNDFVDTGAGNDSITGSTGGDVIDGGSGTDKLILDLDLSAAGFALSYSINNSNNNMDSRSAYSTISTELASAATRYVIVLAGLGYTDATNVEQFQVDLTGTGSNDLLIYQNGTRYQGGAGTDTFYADWSGVTSAITWINDPATTQAVNVGGSNVSLSSLERLLLATGSGNDQISNTLVGTDNWISTGSGNDTVAVGTGNDFVDTGAGNDNLDGGAGADTLNGGNGTDTIDYGNATVGINAALWLNTVSNDGTGAIDTLVSIENLKGGGFADFIVGNESANQLEGLAGNDTFYGGGGADTLLGGDGNDFLSGGAGADSLNGGNGTDTIDYGNATVGINAALWQNTVANDGTGAIDTLVSIENLKGGGFADFIVGDESANQLEGLAGNDTFYAGGGADTLLGGDGNDFLSGGAGADSLNGGNGTDTIDYGNATVGISAALWQNTVSNDGTGAIDTLVGIENLKGGGFADFIVGNESANQLEGLAGNDTFYGGGGADTLLGGDGNDLLNGGAGADSLTGGNGSDTIDYGNATVGINAALWLNTVSNDGTGAIDTLVSIENLKGGGFADFIVGNESANQLEGLAGNDTFYGSGGADTLLGGDGNDFLCGGAGADTLNGGNGTDTIDYGNATVGINAALWLNTVSNDGTGAIDTLVSIENLKGGGFNDFIVGNEGANRLEGLAGNDTFYGGGGADTLLGGDGNDFLVGGNGSDNLTGGLGTDIFDFDAIAESAVGVGRDVITDFSSAQLDRIDLSTLDANTGLANDQAFSYIGNAAFSNVAGQLRFDAGILAGDVNGDGLADFEIQLVGVASLASGDFFL